MTPWNFAWVLRVITDFGWQLGQMSQFKKHTKNNRFEYMVKHYEKYHYENCHEQG